MSECHLPQASQPLLLIASIQMHLVAVLRKFRYRPITPISISRNQFLHNFYPEFETRYMAGFDLIIREMCHYKTRRPHEFHKSCTHGTLRFNPPCRSPQKHICDIRQDGIKEQQDRNLQAFHGESCLAGNKITRYNRRGNHR